MANFLRSFSSIDRKVISEVASRTVESEVSENDKHEEVEDPAQWTPPALHATDIYKLPMTFILKKKNFLKEVEITIKISGPSVQIVALNIFSADEIKKFQKYHKGVNYDQTELPQNWYFQCKSIADNKHPESKLKRVAIENGQVQLIHPRPPRPQIPPPARKPRRTIVPVNIAQLASSSNPIQEVSSDVSQSEPELLPNELYIPESKPFLPIVNKMHRIGRFPPREEWQYASKRYVRGGKWPPRTKYCTTSSSSNQPATRADCAPVVEHNSQDNADLSETLQIGNYVADWCSHAEGVLDDLGCQTEQILANLKLLQDEQAEDRRKQEQKEKRS